MISGTFSHRVTRWRQQLLVSMHPQFKISGTVTLCMTIITLLSVSKLVFRTRGSGMHVILTSLKLLFSYVLFIKSLWLSMSANLPHQDQIPLIVDWLHKQTQNCGFMLDLIRLLPDLWITIQNPEFIHVPYTYTSWTKLLFLLDLNKTYLPRFKKNEEYVRLNEFSQ